MAPVWVVLKEPVVPKRRLGREREAVSDKERPLSPYSVRALRTDPGRSGTRVMMEPPSWLKNEGPLVPTLTTSAMHEPFLGRTRAAKDDNDDYTETSALSGRSMDTTGEPGGSSSGSNLRPGQRQALEFAMRGLPSFDNGSNTRGKNSFLKVKPRRPGEPPTVLEKIVAKHDQRDAEVELKAQEMERRRLARTAAIDQGLDDPGNPTNAVPGASGMNQAQKASAAAATAAAAATGGDAQKFSTRDKMKEFVTRPSNLDSSGEATSVLRKKRAPRPRPPTPPRTAFAGSASIGGRTNLAKGKHDYKLTKESAFYDRARAVAVAHHGPTPEEIAAKAKADEEAAKAELKKRQLMSAKEGVQAFIMKGFKDEDYAERQAAQEVQEAARKAREEDGDYVSRTRKAAEKSMGSGLTPHYSSKTKLIFDRKEREIMQAFLSSGKRGPLGPLGQGLLAGDDEDATSLGAGSGMTSSLGGESRSTRAWSRWGNSSHGTTAVVVTDLVKMSAKASKVNRDLIVALKNAGQHTTAQAVANAAQFAIPSVKAKIAGKGAHYKASSSPERAACASQAAKSDRTIQTGEGGYPDSPHSARSGGSGYSSLTNMSLKQQAKSNYTSPPDARVDFDGGFGQAGRNTSGDADMVTRRATKFAEGGERAIRSGDDDKEADEADAGGLSPRALALKKRREERASRRGAGKAWLQTLAGTPWDPHVATCSHKGCQGCAHHALRARTSFDEPGPSTYALPDLATQVPGGKFNASKAKSNLDWVEYYEKQKVSLKLDYSSLNAAAFTSDSRGDHVGFISCSSSFCAHH